MNLISKTIVITGGTDGLGLALAKALVKKQAQVIIIGQNQAKIDKVSKELGAKAIGYQADVRDYHQLEAVAKKVNSVDVFLNCAGIWLEGLVSQNTPEEIANIIDINLRGVVYATKVFLPLLAKATEAHIINISSTTGLRGRDNQAVYAATKFGVTGFTESLKADLEKTNIKVSGFYPGGMHTHLFNKAGKPKENQDWMDPAKVANIIVFMLEQDATMVMDHVILNKRRTLTSN